MTRSPRGRCAAFTAIGVVLAACQTSTTKEAWQRREKPKVVAAAYDAQGRAMPTPAPSLADMVWGLGPAPGLAFATSPETLGAVPGLQDPAQDPLQDPAQDPTQDKEAQRAAAIRARWGSNVILRADGRVTKQYMLGGESAGVFLQLVTEPGKPPAPPTSPTRYGKEHQPQSVLAQMLGGREVELVFFKDFEKVAGTRIADKVIGTAPVPTGPIGEILNAMVLVTADLDGLVAFEEALNLFFAFAPQVEIEVKVVEYTTFDSMNFGVSQVGTPPNLLPILSNRSSRQLIRGLTETFPLNPPLLGGTSITGRGGLTLGGIHDSWELNARLEMLEANSLADIISRPKMVVRNGGLACVSTSTSFPYPKAKITSSGQNIVADIEFKPVGIVMNIRPMIAGTDTVILEIYADVSVVTGFADTDPVDTPIIANRSVVTSVHVKNGKTAVIGGLKSKSKLDSESKVPILGDIPLLGYLFRSTSTQLSDTALEFYITPRIIESNNMASK